LKGEVTGEIEKEDGVLVIKRIHVLYHLEAPADQRQVIERAFETHPRFCPVYRSLETAIDITTELDLREEREVDREVEG
jgi:uncharacterized OsmC-like protein